MLTIVTGTPGNGKTAHALDLLFFDKSSIWYGLEKYVDGIADLDLEHFEFPTLAELKRPDFVPRSKVDSEEYEVWNPANPLYSEFLLAKATAKTSWDLWFLWATPESVLVIDEAQRYMRPKPSGAPVPLALQMVEYHRHFGIHIVLITQKERLLHTNIRMLTGQHIHLTNGWRGRHRFEWSECKDSDSKAEKSVSAHSSYKLPIHVFPHYKSTVANLKVGHKTPFFMYVVYFCVVLIPVLLFVSYKKFTAPKKPPVSASSPVSAVSDSSSMSASAVPAVSYASGVDSALVAGMAAAEKSFTPVFPGRPESAPAYAGLRKVSIVPRAASCLQNSFKCYCYTQQGTRIDMSKELCEQTLKAGFPFDAYGDSLSDNSTQPAPVTWSRTEPVQPDSSLTAQDKIAISDYKASKVSQ